MSIDVTGWVFENSSAELADRLTLLAVADRADRNGVAWPSVAEVARRTRLKRRAVQLCLRRLERAGELVRVSIGGGRDGRTGRGRTARYVVTMGRPEAAIADVALDLQTAHRGALFGGSENGARDAPERRTAEQGTAQITTKNGAPPCARTEQNDQERLREQRDELLRADLSAAVPSERPADAERYILDRVAAGKRRSAARDAQPLAVPPALAATLPNGKGNGRSAGRVPFEQQQQTIALLIAAGISAADATDLARLGTPAAFRAALQKMPADVRNRGGWLRRAITEGWFAPPGTAAGGP